METFIERPDDKYIAQKKVFCQKIGTYTLTLGLNPAKVAAVVADQLLEEYIFNLADNFTTFGKSMNSFKRLLRNGIAQQVLGAIPTPPTPGTAPTVTSEKAQQRWADLIQDCIRGGLTENQAQDLGIFKSDGPFDPQAGKPVFYIEFSSGGHPLLVWVKGKFQGVEIWVNYGQGWVKLERDFSPDYIDKHPLPAPGVSAVWQYRMIYLYKDEIVGSWTDDEDVTVTGI